MSKNSQTEVSKGYMIAQLDAIEPVTCCCGQSRRAFESPDNNVATLHIVEISKDAKAHYHKKMTEIYYILEGTGRLQLDDEEVPVHPGTAVLIRPGTRHRALGDLRVMVIPVPAYDPSDEYLD